MLQTILDYLTSPGTVVAIVAAVLGVLGKYVLAANRRKQLALVAYHAFHIVEDIDTELGTETLDKWVEGLKAANTYAVENGWRPIKAGEEGLLDLHFQALNGKMKADAKVIADAPLAKG